MTKEITNYLFVICIICLSIRENGATVLGTSKPTIRPEPEEDNIGSKTLIKIIGSISTCFIVILFMQWLIKRFICKKNRPAENSNCEENSTSAQIETIANGSLHISIPESTTLPPSYQDIHLYQQLDLTSCTPIYYNVPGKKNYFGVLLEDIEPDIRGPQLGEPPAYSDNNLNEETQTLRETTINEETEEPVSNSLPIGT